MTGSAGGPLPSSRGRDVLDIAWVASRELGDGWFPARDHSYPEIAYIEHADGRELRLTRSARDSRRLAIQGVIGHRPVGRLITVAAGTSGRGIAGHVGNRLLPSYTARFANEGEPQSAG
jgi:hypothetical protein